MLRSTVRAARLEGIACARAPACEEQAAHAALSLSLSPRVPAGRRSPAPAVRREDAARLALATTAAAAAVAALAIYALACVGPLEEQEDVVIPEVTPVPNRDAIVTTCNMCTLGCSVVATREGDRLVRLRGNPNSPVNRGRLCAKGHAGLYKVVHPERLGEPLVRAGKRGEGRFRRASWAEALRLVARELRALRSEHGPRSIALWQNLNMERPAPFRRFVHALGSPNFIGHISTCDASRIVGGVVTFGAERAEYDYARAGCIVAVGMNPLGARDLVLAAREIMEARANGAALVTVDPRMSETAARSDVWIPIQWRASATARSCSSAQCRTNPGSRGSAPTTRCRRR